MPYFCPRCHKMIVIPEFLKKDNVVIKGEVKVNCGNCKKGFVTITKQEI